MARYIDADRLVEMIYARAEMLFEGKEAFFYVAGWLNKLPTADVVEVVRCGDCKFYEEVEYYHPADNNAIKTVCRLYKRTMQEDDFCSYGERR